MHISGDNDRFLVCSYGRAGSLALSERLYSYLINKNNQPPKWYGFGQDQYNESNFDPLFNNNDQAIGHCHSLKQIEFSYNCSQLFFAFRLPHEVSISMVLAGMLKYQHTYTTEYVEKIKNKKIKIPYYERVLTYTNNFNKNEKVELDINTLQWTRDNCIEWNNMFLNIINYTPLFRFNYNKWGQDMDQYCLNIGCTLNPEYFSVVKNPRMWEDSVVNIDEVKNWILSVYSDDKRIMDQWEAIS